MPSFVMLLQGSASHLSLRNESVQCIVTSPPYWGLRQYAGEQRQVWGGEPGHAHEWGERGRVHKGGPHGERGALKGGSRAVVEAQAAVKDIEIGPFCACGAWYGALGLEPTPEMYVEHIVAIFREVRRVLRKDGTIWLNLGDSYAGSGKGGGGSFDAERPGWETIKSKRNASRWGGGNLPATEGLKPKDLVGIPWMVAFALRADGWYLRSDIIWSKPNPMPESVTDRPTKAHEYLFLLTKRARYFYNADAIKEQAATGKWDAMPPIGGVKQVEGNNNNTYSGNRPANDGRRNKRTVWTIATQPYADAHFATFPEALVEPCIRAGSRPGDVVLDPFNGSGTTGRVAIRHGRSYIGLDISREYLVEQATKRTTNIQMEAAL